MKRKYCLAISLSLIILLLNCTPAPASNAELPGFLDEPAIREGVYPSIVLSIGKSTMNVGGAQKDIDPGFDTSPVLLNGSAFVPVRAVVESLGGTVSWWSADLSTTVSLNGVSLVFKNGSKTAAVNGVKKDLPDAPFISSTGRTMLPLRFIAESLGFGVGWDASNQTITIY